MIWAWQWTSWNVCISIYILEQIISALFNLDQVRGFLYVVKYCQNLRWYYYLPSGAFTWISYAKFPSLQDQRRPCLCFCLSQTPKVIEGCQKCCCSPSQNWMCCVAQDPSAETSRNRALCPDLSTAWHMIRHDTMLLLQHTQFQAKQFFSQLPPVLGLYRVGVIWPWTTLQKPLALVSEMTTSLPHLGHWSSRL